MMSYVTHTKDTKKLHLRNTSLHRDIGYWWQEVDCWGATALTAYGGSMRQGTGAGAELAGAPCFLRLTGQDSAPSLKLFLQLENSANLALHKKRNFKSWGEAAPLVRGYLAIRWKDKLSCYLKKKKKDSCRVSSSHWQLFTLICL